MSLRYAPQTFEPAQTHPTGARGVQFRRALQAMPASEREAAMKPPRPLQYKGGQGEADAVHATAAKGVAGGGGALPHGDAIQKSFGRHDVSQVQAHTGGAAKDASQALGAEAYATGNDVAFADANPTLHTAAHEAAHIVQQKAGVSLKGGVGAEGDPYERHADQVADAVVQGKSAEGLLDKFAGGGGAGVQFEKGKKTANTSEADTKADKGAKEAGIDAAAARKALKDAVASQYGGAFQESLDALDNPGVVFSLNASWPIPGTGTETLDARGELYGPIASAFASMRERIINAFGGPEGVDQVRFALGKRAGTVAGAPTDLEAKFNRCVEGDASYALREYAGLEKFGPPRESLAQELDFIANPKAPAKEMYAERYMDTLTSYGVKLATYADIWRRSVEFYAETITTVAAELDGVYLLTLPGDKPVYVKPGEEAPFFLKHEASIAELSGAIKAGFDRSKNELAAQQELNDTLAGMVVQAFSDDFDTSTMFPAENAVSAACMKALAQQTLATGDPGARFDGIIASYTALVSAADASEAFAAAISDWKKDLMATAEGLVDTCRTIRSVSLAVLSAAAGGHLVPIFQGWGMARGVAVVLETATLQLATSTVTEVSEAGGDPDKIKYGKIAKEVGTAALKKAMEPVGKALPVYARKLGYPEFANAYVTEVSDAAMSALVEQSVVDTIKVLEGKEISDEDFMKAVLEKVLVAAPNKYLGDTIKKAELNPHVGNAVKGIGEKTAELGASRLTGTATPGALGEVVTAGVSGVAEGLPEQASDHPSRTAKDDEDTQ